MAVVPLEPEAPSIGPPDRASRRGSASAARAALVALYFAVLPVLLAGLVLRYLVPPVVAGGSDFVKDAIGFAQERPLPLGVLLFFLFASAARYWRFALPGGRYLAPAGAPWTEPALRRAFAEAAALERSLGTVRMRRRLGRSLSAERLADLDARLFEVRGGLEARDEALACASASAARAIAAPVLGRASRREVLSLALGIAVVAAGTFGLRSRVVESYSVLSGSMLPTLQSEDRLLGNRLAYRTWTGAASAKRSPRRGDMVVFKTSAVDGGNLTNSPDYLVKRVIGLPGDRISMRGNIPVINGWAVPVCDAAEYLYVLQGGENGLSARLIVEFLEDRAYLTAYTIGSAPFTDTFEVQPGEVFVLGDNRNNSSDSRAWNDHHGGGVPRDAIEARVQWFVAGRRADFNWDFSRFLKPVDSLATKVHLDGVDVARVQTGIDKCLKKWPEKTYPPAPGEGERESGDKAGAGTGTGAETSAGPETGAGAGTATTGAGAGGTP